jgi:hypothetical protein
MRDADDFWAGKRIFPGVAWPMREGRQRKDTGISIPDLIEYRQLQGARAEVIPQRLWWFLLTMPRTKQGEIILQRYESFLHSMNGSLNLAVWFQDMGPRHKKSQIFDASVPFVPVFSFRQRLVLQNIRPRRAAAYPLGPGVTFYYLWYLLGEPLCVRLLLKPGHKTAWNWAVLSVDFLLRQVRTFRKSC